VIKSVVIHRNTFECALNHNLFCLVKFVWPANIKPNRIASASCGFLAAARLSSLWKDGRTDGQMESETGVIV